MPGRRRQPRLPPARGGSRCDQEDGEPAPGGPHPARRRGPRGRRRLRRTPPGAPGLRTPGRRPAALRAGPGPDPDGLDAAGEVEAIVDIGADVVSVVVHAGGVPRYVRMIPGVGGDSITQAVQQRYEWTWEDAERTKVFVGLPGHARLDAAQREAVGPATTGSTTPPRRSSPRPPRPGRRRSAPPWTSTAPRPPRPPRPTARTRSTDVARLLLAGSGARLGGLRELLEQRLGPRRRDAGRDADFCRPPAGRARPATTRPSPSPPACCAGAGPMKGRGGRQPPAAGPALGQPALASGVRPAGGPPAAQALRRPARVALVVLVGAGLDRPAPARSPRPEAGGGRAGRRPARLSSETRTLRPIKTYVAGVAAQKATVSTTMAREIYFSQVLDGIRRGHPGRRHAADVAVTLAAADPRRRRRGRPPGPRRPPGASRPAPGPTRSRPSR